MIINKLIGLALLIALLVACNATPPQIQEAAPTPAPSSNPLALSENAVTTESGLQYEDTIIGEGETSAIGNVATVNYTGYLEDGTIFDTSQNAPPYAFILGAEQVIKGWDEGLVGMNVGSQRRLRVPPELGYSDVAVGDIPANSTLIFNVELLSIETLPTPEAVDSFQETENGVQYAILVEGSEPVAQRGDLVTFEFNAWVQDGFHYNSSNRQGGPSQYQLGLSYISSLDEGIEGMKVGEKRQLRIPPELAYGEEGYPPEIPSNATLIYEIALQAIDPLPRATEVDEGDYTETDSGLKYIILEEGDGAEARNGDTVTMQYHGWLTDGLLFDSSLLREIGYAFTLGKGQVIAGWEEGIEGMKVGETRQLRIPPELAYAESGYPPYIPTEAELIFEVTLEDSQEPPELTEVKEEEYTETDSGLRYTTLKEGDGNKAENGNTVQVHYSGWLEDGTLFDTSRLRDIPYAFILGESQVITGWEEGVEGMAVGEVRQLRIPPELAYAETGYPPYIPPDATLVFEIELLEIE